MDAGLGTILSAAAPYALAMSRVAGLVVVAPMLSSISVPTMVRALVAASMALAAYPAASAGVPGLRLDLAGLLPVIASETLVGACIGMIASLPMLALQIGGHVAGFQMGLSIASIYNPDYDAQSDALGELLFYVGFFAFLSAGGLEAAFGSLLVTFERVPLGGLSLVGAPLEAYAELLGAGFEVALRVSAPATAMVFLVMVAMGFVMKTMPQLNVMSVGFAVKIVLGLLATATALAAIGHVADGYTGQVWDALFDWVSAPVGATGGED